MNADQQIFIDLFTPKEGDELIPWVEGEGIGFTVLRNYPDDSAFRPAKDKNGKNDSAVMIRVGFYRKDKNKEDLPLIIDVSKASRYLLKNHWDYNFDDENSPTQASVAESKLSKQPIDLETRDEFLYIPKSKVIFAKKKNTNISLNETVDYMYNLHLATISLRGLWFRLKYNSRDRFAAYVEPTNDFLKSIITFLGKSIKTDPKDFATGVFSPIPHKNLISLEPERVNFLGTDFPVTRRSILFFSIIIVISSFVIESWKPKFWFFHFLKSSPNQVVMISFVVAGLWLIDYVLPHLILLLINTLIIIRNWLWRLKLHFK